ncbi:hypothetical protein COBT_000178 [Conglomerata obtusa]
MNISVTGDKELFTFLSNAPKEFREGEKIKKYQLKNGDYIHCVLWNMHFYITGTDIVKILVWRFQNAGRSLVSIKKFEEGVFSDLRNLKPGIDATLEGPRSEFLEFLYKNGCIRTQKKQKVFFWYSVPHDALFCDALERDLRRETNIYSYSKYMNNLASQNYTEGSEQFPISPFGRHAQTLKKKNSVKLAARSKRSPPKDQQTFKSGTGFATAQSAKNSQFSVPLPISDTNSIDQNVYLDYNAFNPTQPDPFLSFGPQTSFNYNYTDIGFGENFDAKEVEFGKYDRPTLNTKQSYAMPEFFGEKKEEFGGENSFINRGYIQNIPNTHGKPQK